MGAMKKSTIILLSIVGVLVLSVLWFVSAGNRLVGLDEGFNEARAQVENVYQRRADLIPNLVSTVKGYAKHEAEVLTQVTQARSQVGQVKLNSPADLKKFDEAQGALSQALSRLMVVAERYPDLKANQNFMELQSQLEGTENRITIERQRFNGAAREFNQAIRTFPTSVVAGFRGFTPKEYFAAQAGAATAPKVEF